MPVHEQLLICLSNIFVIAAGIGIAICPPVVRKNYIGRDWRKIVRGIGWTIFVIGLLGLVPMLYFANNGTPVH